MATIISYPDEERKLYYRECVAALVVELLLAFGKDDVILDEYLSIPTKHDRFEIKREVEKFRNTMENIENDCTSERRKLNV